MKRKSNYVLGPGTDPQSFLLVHLYQYPFVFFLSVYTIYYVPLLLLEHKRRTYPSYTAFCLIIFT